MTSQNNIESKSEVKIHGQVFFLVSIVFFLDPMGVYKLKIILEKFGYTCVKILCYPKLPNNYLSLLTKQFLIFSKGTIIRLLFFKKLFFSVKLKNIFFSKYFNVVFEKRLLQKNCFQIFSKNSLFFAREDNYSAIQGTYREKIFISFFTAPQTCVFVVILYSSFIFRLKMTIVMNNKITTINSNPVGSPSSQDQLLQIDNSIIRADLQIKESVTQ